MAGDAQVIAHDSARSGLYIKETIAVNTTLASGICIRKPNTTLNNH